MQPIDEKTWIEWRCKLGCRKAEAKRLYREYLELLLECESSVRMMKPRHNETWEQALTAFVDQMPRRPTRFLAMVAESEQRQAIRERLRARKASGRRKYLRRVNRRAKPNRERCSAPALTTAGRVGDTVRPTSPGAGRQISGIPTVSATPTRVWIDCEFNEFRGELISMALVTESGIEWYRALHCSNPGAWVAQRVMPVLAVEPIGRAEFTMSLERWLRPFRAIHVIADWPEDIVHFCESLIVAIAAVRSLIGMGFECWVATKPPTGIPHAYADKADWILRHLPELKRRIIMTHDKGLLGDDNDYLIDRPHKANCERFRGALIHFGNGVTWEGVLGTMRKERGAETVDARHE
jgi:hypothetical protein